MDKADFAKPIVMWLSILVLNFGVFWILRQALRRLDIRSVLREKDADSQPKGTQPVGSAPKLVAADGDPPLNATVTASDPALDNTSYSRVSGFIGSTVMACFLWAISNYVLYAAFCDADNIAKLLASLGTYFLAGASLFAPYAVNQLSKVFKTS